jgi:hypothetical protein
MGAGEGGSPQRARRAQSGGFNRGWRRAGGGAMAPIIPALPWVGRLDYSERVSTSHGS